VDNQTVMVACKKFVSVIPDKGASLGHDSVMLEQVKGCLERARARIDFPVSAVLEALGKKWPGSKKNLSRPSSLRCYHSRPISVRGSIICFSG
jgi:hypothetical protein